MRVLERNASDGVNPINLIQLGSLYLTRLSSFNRTLTKQNKCNALLAMGVQGVAATIVCLIAIALVFIFKLYQYFAHRLALYQVLATTLLYGAALAMEHTEMKNPGCKAISFFFLYFSWVKLMFTSWVVLYLLCFSVFYKLEISNILRSCL